MTNMEPPLYENKTTLPIPTKEPLTTADSSGNGESGMVGSKQIPKLFMGKSWRFWAVIPSLMVTTLLSAVEVTGTSSFFSLPPTWALNSIHTLLVNHNTQFYLQRYPRSFTRLMSAKTIRGLSTLFFSPGSSASLPFNTTSVSNLISVLHSSPSWASLPIPGAAGGQPSLL